MQVWRKAKAEPTSPQESCCVRLYTMELSFGDLLGDATSWNESAQAKRRYRLLSPITAPHNVGTNCETEQATQGERKRASERVHPGWCERGNKNNQVVKGKLLMICCLLVSVTSTSKYTGLFFWAVTCCCSYEDCDGAELASFGEDSAKCFAAEGWFYLAAWSLRQLEEMFTLNAVASLSRPRTFSGSGEADWAFCQSSNRHSL